MSTILDALEKAKKDRERHLSGQAGGADHAPVPEPPIQQPLGGPMNPPIGPRRTPTRGPGAGLLVGIVLAVSFLVVLGGGIFAVKLMTTPKVEAPVPAPTPGPTPYVIVLTPVPTPVVVPPEPVPAATPESSRSIYATDHSTDDAMRISDIRFDDAETAARIAAIEAQGPPYRVNVPPLSGRDPNVVAPRQGEMTRMMGAPAGGPTPAPGLAIDVEGPVYSKPIDPPPATPGIDAMVLAEDFNVFRIDAILFDARQPAIMVGGRERYPGDEVQGYKVDKIEPKSVRLTKGDLAWVVKF